MLVAEKEDKEENSGKASSGENNVDIDTVEDERVQHLQCLSKLKTLKLEFYKSDMLPGSTYIVAKLLENLPQLRDLGVSFEELPWKTESGWDGFRKSSTPI